MAVSGKSRNVEEERVSRALARIEAAARRIEAAVSSVSASRTQVSPDAELARKHESLRREASAALADMDRLIGMLEQ